ncbi:MAG: hypothetical protein ACHQ1G_08345 [Planctomycetota bacterium]
MRAKGPAAFVEDGRAYAAYRSTRLTFRRDAWDLLPDDGVLIEAIRPPQGLSSSSR